MSENKFSNTRKPEEISIDEWQAGLRKQFVVDQKFKFINTGDHPVYSDFEVFNPKTENKYKVSIRDNVNSYNYCSCPDFRINGLGTCKHVEYMLYYFSRYKRYWKYLGKPHVPKYSSLSIFYGNERKVWLKKAINADTLSGEEGLFDNIGFLINGKLPELPSYIELAIKIEPGFRVYPDVFDKIDLDKKNRERSQIIRQLFIRGIESEIFAGLLNTTLYSYQKEGVRRIVETGRILLADEMGLGKTVQTIAATEVFSRHLGVKSVLIICPTSLKYQWQKEIQKFTGRNAIVIEGSPLARSELYRVNTFYKIISYGACSNDSDKLSLLNPDLVIVDEAQRIKNWKTKTAQAVKRVNSDFAIVLTGTPLENRIEDLHSLMEFVDQYKLGPLFRFLDAHQVLDERGKLTGYKNLREIHKTLDDVLLRRNLKLDMKFEPCPASEGDELFPNGIFIFNISRMLGYIVENPDLFTPEAVAVKEIYFSSSLINKDHLDSVDVSKPVILAEIAPDRYNLIDGHHRVEKVVRGKSDTIKAYRLKAHQHIHFLTSREAYEKYVEYWNNIIMDQNNCDAKDP